MAFDLTDLYIKLFGKEHIQDGDVIEMAEHGRVGGVSTGQPFKHVSVIDGSLPTAGNNPSTLVSYNAAGEAVYVDETISGVTYRTTLTRSDMTVTSTLPISATVAL